MRKLIPDGYSRRAFLGVVGGALGSAWLKVGAATPSLLSSAEFADVAAIAAQIIPTDATPGAREAGVAQFIDRALATVFARFARDFRDQLAAFQLRYRTQYPAASSFAALTDQQQLEFLKQVERTPFFERVRLLTIIGMFAMPKYGGNRDGVGWKLIGFQDQHIFQPPFGHYDRNYRA